MPTIATWNINSVKARIGLLVEWLRRESPDILLLQETKCEDHAFPTLEIEDLGYNLALCGQKTYNGVAILSKFPLEDIRKGLDGEPEDEQCRYIEAVASLPHGEALRVASVYVPNGQAVGSDKFAYKLRFMGRLQRHLAQLLRYEEQCIVGGDYNIAPFASDVHDPASLDGSVCYHPEERRLMRSLLHLGYYDAFRISHPEARQFSWWDYRANAYERGHGLRIDHLLLSPQSVDKFVDCRIDESPRHADKPSDHAPVIVSIR